jgi:hypothetical protein
MKVFLSSWRWWLKTVTFILVEVLQSISSAIGVRVNRLGEMPARRWL